MFGSGNMGQNNWGGGGRCPFQMDWTPALVNPRSAPDWQFRSFSPIECIRLLQQTSQQHRATVLSADDSASRRKRAASEWWPVLCGSDAAFVRILWPLVAGSRSRRRRPSNSRFPRSWATCCCATRTDLTSKLNRKWNSPSSSRASTTSHVSCAVYSSFRSHCRSSRTGLRLV